MEKKPRLAVERLREVLDYDPSNGEFRWKVRTSNRVRVGERAGCLNSSLGYRSIGLDGEQFWAHHLAWYYINGHWPALDLDHRNGLRDDNRIGNLREDPGGMNAQNLHGAQRNNQSGFLGVCRKGNRWLAQLTAGGSRVWQATFDTPEEAHAAYLAMKAEMHPFHDACST